MLEADGTIWVVPLEKKDGLERVARAAGSGSSAASRPRQRVESLEGVPVILDLRLEEGGHPQVPMGGAAMPEPLLREAEAKVGVVGERVAVDDLTKAVRGQLKAPWP